MSNLFKNKYFAIAREAVHDNKFSIMGIFRLISEVWVTLKSIVTFEV